jgi:hypothetical protein
MRTSKTARVLTVLIALLTGAALLLTPTSSQAAQTQATQSRAGAWAAAGTAKLHPGVQAYTRGAQCTTNFVFADRAGHVYLGYAAHCAGRGEVTDTDGCSTRSHPLGTKVRFAEGATVATSGTTLGHGRLAYSSWLAMKENAAGKNACAANDLALVRVSRKDADKVNPSVPFWGGPVGLSTRGADLGTQVYSYGQSSLRPTTALSPKAGASLGSTNGGWGWDVYTASPGIPGDSGSGFLDQDGRAVGTLSTVAIAPLAGSNGLGDLEHELRYAQQHSGIAGLRLVRGTEPFSPPL